MPIVIAHKFYATSAMKKEVRRRQIRSQNQMSFWYKPTKRSYVKFEKYSKEHFELDPINSQISTSKHLQKFLPAN